MAEQRREKRLAKAKHRLDELKKRKAKEEKGDERLSEAKAKNSAAKEMRS